MQREKSLLLLRCNAKNYCYREKKSVLQGKIECCLCLQSKNRVLSLLLHRKYNWNHILKQKKQYWNKTHIYFFRSWLTKTATKNFSLFSSRSLTENWQKQNTYFKQQQQSNNNTEYHTKKRAAKITKTNFQTTFKPNNYNKHMHKSYTNLVEFDYFCKNFEEEVEKKH